MFAPSPRLTRNCTFVLPVCICLVPSSPVPLFPVPCREAADHAAWLAQLEASRTASLEAAHASKAFTKDFEAAGFDLDELSIVETPYNFYQAEIMEEKKKILDTHNEIYKLVHLLLPNK